MCDNTCDVFRYIQYDMELLPASYRFKILPWSNIARGISYSHQGSDNIYRLSVILNTLECELMFCKIYCNLASKPCTP